MQSHPSPHSIAIVTECMSSAISTACSNSYGMRTGNETSYGMRTGNEAIIMAVQWLYMVIIGLCHYIHTSESVH